MSRTVIHYSEFDITQFGWELPKAQTDKNGNNGHHIAEPLYKGQKNINIEFPEFKCGGIKRTVLSEPGKADKVSHKLNFMIDPTNPEHLKARDILVAIYNNFLQHCTIPEFYTAMGRSKPVTPDNVEDLQFRPPVFHPVETDPKNKKIVTKVHKDKELFSAKLIYVPEKNFYTTFEFRNPNDPKKLVSVPWEWVTPTEKVKLTLTLIPLININRFMLTATAKSLQISCRSAVLSKPPTQGDFESLQKGTVMGQSLEEANAISSAFEEIKLLRANSDASPLGDSTVKSVDTFTVPGSTSMLATGQLPQIPAPAAVAAVSSSSPPTISQQFAPAPSSLSQFSDPGPMRFNVVQPATSSADLAAIAASAQRPSVGLGSLPLMQQS